MAVRPLPRRVAWLRLVHVAWRGATTTAIFWQLAECDVEELAIYTSGCLHNMRIALNDGEKVHAIADKWQA